MDRRPVPPPAAERPRLTAALRAVVLAAFAAASLGLAWAPSGLRADEVPSDSTPLVRADSPDTLEGLRALEARFRELSRTVMPATVGVRVGGAAGSGVIISKEGLILTAAHVSGEPGRRATVILHDGRRLRAESLGADVGIDAGLMRVTEEVELPFVEMAESDTTTKGSWCLAVGHPGGWRADRSAPVRIGRVLEPGRDALRTDCLLIGGDSGGPLFDLDGKVIGIHSRISTSPRSNIHVPIRAYRDSWERLLASERWGGPEERGPRRDGPWMGITADPTADAAVIGTVIDDSPAAKAGLRPGDTIVEFEDEKVATFGDLAAKVRAKKVGDSVTLGVRRGDETVEIEVELGAYGGGR